MLAYLHWYGASYIGSDKVMAMLKYWHEQYGWYGINMS
ncbi:hypothetical protein [Trichormus azollae]